MGSFLAVLILVYVPYALMRHGLKTDGPLALAVSLLMTPFTTYGVMIIAALLGMSGTGVTGMVFIVVSILIGAPAGLILLVIHTIFWRNRPVIR
jgi:hypothetical protein